MRNKFGYSICGALACAMVVVWMPQGAAAAAHTLSPAVIDLAIAPRDIIDQTIVLTNNSLAKTRYFPAINNVTTGVDGGVQEFVPPSMSDRTASLASWMEIQRSAIELMPGERKEISLTIRVAPEAKPGEYHAMIAYAPGTTIDDAMRLINAREVPITFINATLADTKVEQLNLSRFTVKKFVTGVHEGDAQYRVENSGDTELVPSGDIIIFNQRGEEVATLPVNAKKESVKPGETIVFKTSVPIDEMLGKYKAFLTLRYGDNRAAVNDTVYFFAFPWKKVLIAFAIFLICAVVLALLVHRRAAKKRALYDDDDEIYEDDASDAVGILPVAVRKTTTSPHHRDVVIKK